MTHETSSRSPRWWVAPAAVLALAILGACIRVPPAQIPTLDPPLQQNYAKHVYFTNFHARTICDAGEFWGYDPTSMTNTIDVFISNLRRKLEEGGEDRILHTKRGAGYVVRV